MSVVLSVLLDLSPRDALALAPAAPKPPLVVLPPRAETKTAASPAALTFGLGVEGGLGYGLLGGTWVGAFSAAIRPRFEHWELALGGLWAPNRTIDYSPGTVTVSLLSAELEACGWLSPSASRPDLGLCGGVLFGAIRGDAQGFTEAYGANDPWVALEAGLHGRLPLAAKSALRLGISALIPARPQRFEIANEGTPYESSDAALLVEVGPELRFP